MQKNVLRDVKTAAGGRWNLLKHNTKNADKIISLYDKAILTNLVPGSTLFLSITGLQYTGLIDDFSILDQKVDFYLNADKKGYQNLIFLNDLFLKYKTLDEIAYFVLDHVKKHLEEGGHLIIGFNYQFVKFNRIKYKFSDAIKKFIALLETQGLRLVHNLSKKIPSTDPYGDNLFIFKFLKKTP